MRLLPRGFPDRSAGERPAAASASFRCSSSRSARAAFQSFSVGAAGGANQLLPFWGNDPRFSPVSIRRTAYFQ